MFWPLPVLSVLRNVFFVIFSMILKTWQSHLYNVLTVPELEDSPERKLELLYGVTLPDWCVHGTDLPGIYKEIAEKTTDACDAIDTNRLFPILMASDLPRDKLGHIWNRANRAVPGQLNLLELRIVLGLVALGQVCSPVLLWVSAMTENDAL